MEATFILTVALASAMIVVVLALVCIIIYYRWLGRFIDENERLREKINRTGIMNQ